MSYVIKRIKKIGKIIKIIKTGEIPFSKFFKTLYTSAGVKVFF
jgi:hypothetical protein